MKYLTALALLSAASFSQALPNNPLKARQATVTVTIPAAVPSPSSSSYDWTAGAVNDYPIHFSCNATERRQLKRGLDEAVALAAHARDHIRRFGRDSPLYRRYFGNATTGEPIGWFDKIVSGDRGKVLFRCDDIDGNCWLDGWGGHWRGSNATTETVICPLSYTTRRPLEGLCGFGYTVSAGSLNFYFSSDLIHRLYHMPPVGEGVVEHYADTHAECLQLAKTSPEKAVRNTHSLQYFALDAYAYDLALPGVGCAGVQASGSATSSKATTTATATATRSATTPPTTKPPVSTTSTLPPNCHTHDGGELHCV